MTAVISRCHCHILYNPCSGFGCAKVALEFVTLSEVTKSANYIIQHSNSTILNKFSSETDFVLPELP
jgi:hypothetical protein